MIFDFLYNKPETDEQRVIRWADAIIANSDYTGELNNECLDPFAEFWRDNPITLPTALTQIRNEVISRQPKNNDGTTVHLDITKQYIQGIYDIVRNHLLNSGYINTPDHTRKWILNDRGKLMKELGGHRNYVRHRRREINLFKNQGKINNWLIGATIAAAVMPFIAAWVFTTKVYNTNVLPAPVYRPDIRIDSVWLHQQVDAALRKIKSNPDTVLQLRLQRPN